jgi:hypothetical protein
MSTTKSRIPLSLNSIVSDSQLAEFLGIENKSHLAKLVRNLPHRKIGHTKLISVQQLWDSLQESGNE